MSAVSAKRSRVRTRKPCSLAAMGIEVDEQPGDADLDIGDLEALQGVVKFPVRIKCAVLGWNTVTDALSKAASASAGTR